MKTWLNVTCKSIVSLLSLNGTWESPFAMDSTTLFKAMFPWLIFAVCNKINNEQDENLHTHWARNNATCTLPTHTKWTRFNVMHTLVTWVKHGMIRLAHNIKEKTNTDGIGWSKWRRRHRYTHATTLNANMKFRCKVA